MKQSNKKTPIVIAISGGGTTLKNLLSQEGKFDSYQISGVIASSTNCKGLSFARENNLPIHVADFSKQDEGFIEELSSWLNTVKAEWILLGGFLKKFPSLENYRNKIINIHPALLPNFGGKGMYGKRVHQAVIEAKKDISGASIHFVNEEYDEGNIISQIKVKVNKDDTAESLAKKVFDGECVLFPKTIDLLIHNQLPIKGTIKDFSYES